MSGIKKYFTFVQFEHSIFALPYAVACAMLVETQIGTSGPRTGVFGVSWAQWFWLAAAMVAARTYGMGLNRIIDRHLDDTNPRTRGRGLVTGEVSPAAAWLIIIASAALLVFAAGRLSSLALALSPAALVVLGFYSLAKRFTWATHFALGACYFMIPYAVCIALCPNYGSGTEHFIWLIRNPVVLCMAISAACWVAGFDILYSLQDMEHDRSAGIHSIPARFGVSASLRISRALHIVTLAGLFLAGRFAGLGLVWQTGLAVLAALFVWEHSLVKADDLSKVNRAFFTANGWIAMLIPIFIGIDIAWK